MTTQQEVSLVIVSPMEHISNEGKEEAKQEMRAQNAELQEQVQNLKEELAKKDAAMKKLEKVSCRNTSVEQP